MTIPAGMLDTRARFTLVDEDADTTETLSVQANVRPVSRESEAGVIIRDTGLLDITIRRSVKALTISSGDTVEVRGRTYTVREVFDRHRDRLIDVRAASG